MSDAGRSHEPPSELRRRRDELAERVAKLQWDLGGLTYEMAIRDHFRVDVLVKRAAMLQERDAELAELERLLRMEESAVAGSCTTCGAVRSRGAVFCWQCGAQVMERSAGIAGKADAETVAVEPVSVRTDAKTATADVRSAASDVETVEADAETVEIDTAPVASNGSLGRPVQSSS
jgi:uncharacterized Zn finger protein (UPF0148 family)